LAGNAPSGFIAFGFCITALLNSGNWKSLSFESQKKSSRRTRTWTLEVALKEEFEKK
jgi:hypothetical protein